MVEIGKYDIKDKNSKIRYRRNIIFLRLNQKGNLVKLLENKAALSISHCSECDCC